MLTRLFERELFTIFNDRVGRVRRVRLLDKNTLGNAFYIAAIAGPCIIHNFEIVLIGFRPAGRIVCGQRDKRKANIV